MNLHRHFCTWLLCLSAIGLSNAQASFPLVPIGSPPGVEITKMATLPDGTLFAMATNSGMLRTEDRGQTWAEATEGLPGGLYLARVREGRRGQVVGLVRVVLF